MSTVDVKKISKKQTWCLELRNILQLGEGGLNPLKFVKNKLVTTDSEQLIKNDKAARNGLKALNAKNPAKFQELGGRYQELSKQATGLAEGDKDTILIISEELDVLAKQVQAAIAFENAKGKPTGSKEVKAASEASDAFLDAQQKLKGRTEKLLEQAERDVSQIVVQPYSSFSPACKTLQDTTTKWRNAYNLTAKNPQDVFDYSKALTELATTPELATRARAEIKVDQDAAILHAEYKAKYESKVERLKRVQESLAGHLGAEGALQKIAEALRAGAEGIKIPSGAHVQEPKYYTGYERIKEVVPKTSGLEKQSLKQEKTLLKDLLKDKSVAPVWQAAQEALAALVVSGKEMISSAEYAGYTGQLNGLLGQCVDTAKKVSALQELATKTQDLKKLFTKRSADSAACTNLLQVVREGLKTLSFAPSDDERTLINDWNNTLRRAEVDCGNCDFATARELLQAIEAKLTPALTSSGTTKDKWAEKWNDPAHATMRLWIKDQIKQLCPQGVKPGDTMQAKQLALCDKRAGSGDYSGAIELLENLHSDTQRAISSQSFAASDDFQKIDQEVQKEVTAAQGKLDKLLAALQPSDSQGVTAKAQTTRLTEIKNRWNQIKTSAVSAADLDSAAYIKQLQVLTADYERILSKPQALQGMVTQATLKADMQALDAAIGTVNTALAELANHDRGPRYVRLLAERDKLRDSAPDDGGGYPASTRAMLALAQSVAGATTAAEQEHTTALKEFNTKLEEIRRSIADLRKAEKKSLNSKQKKFFEPYFLDLDTDFASLADFAKSPSLALLKQGQLELTRLGNRIAQIRQDMNEPVGELSELVATALGKNDGTPDPEDEDDLGIAALFSEEPTTQGPPEIKLSDKVKATFQLVAAAVTSLTLQLKSENLKKCKPTRLALLSQDFAAVQTTVKSQEPAEGLKTLFAFQKALTENLELADAAAAQRAEFNATLKPEAKQLYKGITGYQLEARLSKVGKEQKAVYEEWSQQYTAAKGLLETEDKEQEALDKLTDLIGKLKRGAAPGELLKMETEAQSRELQAKKDAEAWEMAVGEYERVMLPRVEQALQVDGADQTQLADCKNLLKKAKDQWKSTKSLAGSQVLLEMAQERARVAIQFPLGTVATARNELPKSVERWKKAITAFNTSIDGVVKNIKTEVDKAIESSQNLDKVPNDVGEVEKSAQEATRTLNGLKRLFNPTAFDKAVSVMAAKKVEKRAARAAREEGLREVRRYFDLLYKDPVLVKLMQNPRPFGTVEESTVYTALRDLDLNLQRGA